MALDGIVIANIRQELEQTLLGGRFIKSHSLKPMNCSLRLKHQNSSTGLSFQPMPACR